MRKKSILKCKGDAYYDGKNIKKVLKEGVRNMDKHYIDRIIFEGEENEIQSLKNELAGVELEEVEGKIILYATDGIEESAFKPLSEKCPNLYITYEWSEEEIGRNTGVMEYYKGELVCIDIPTPYSKEAYEMSSDILGVDFQDEYEYSEQEGEYCKIDRANEINFQIN